MLSVMGYAFAAPTTTASMLYDIEVIVFANHLPDLEGAEHWKDDATKSSAPAGTDVLIPDETNQELGLQGLANALGKGSQYKVLAHRRWQQNAEAKSETKTVKLSSPEAGLDGSLKFYLSRFLFVDANLVLKDPKNENAPAFRLIEHRRVKVQELHYFDHPKMGMLIRVMSLGKN
jgi:hypothetical protein